MKYQIRDPDGLNPERFESWREAGLRALELTLQRGYGHIVELEDGMPVAEIRPGTRVAMERSIERAINEAADIAEHFDGDLY